VYLLFSKEQRCKFDYQRRDLPGQPDFVFPRRKKVISVHGCFWHQHKGCNRATAPGTNRGYSKNKLAGNVIRGRQVSARLLRDGWKIMYVWECQTKPTAMLALKRRIDLFLGRGPSLALGMPRQKTDGVNVRIAVGNLR